MNGISALLEAHFLSTKAFVFITDEHGQVLFANPSYKSLCQNAGKPSDSALSSLFKSPDSAQIQNVLKKTILNAGTTEYLSADITTEKGLISVQWQVSASDQRCLWIGQDISDLKNNEIFLRQTQSASHIGAWTLDKKTGKTTWSEETYRIHEVPVGTPTDTQNGISFYAPEAQSIIATSVQRALEEGTPFQLILPFVTAKGKKLKVKATGTPTYTGTEITGLHGTFQDVTQLALEQEAQQSQSEFMKHILEQAPGMIYQFILTPDGKMSFPFVSQKAFDIFELDQSDFDANPAIMLEMADPEGRDNLNQSIMESAQHMTPFRWIGRIRTKSKKIKWVTVQSMPTKKEDGSILWFGIAIDTTREKELAEALEAERAQSIHNSKLAALGEMAGGIAHEINNPLAIISGKVGLLKSKAKSGQFDFEKCQMELEKIENTVQRISKIINGLRAFARDSERDAKIPTSLQSIVQETLDLCQEKLKVNGVDLKLNLEANPSIICRPTQISQVLLNLISNSADACLEQNEKWISIEAKMNHQSVFLTVRDSGQGIPKEIQERIMMPFFTTKSVGKGTGLGLSISKRIIEEHGGSLSYNDRSKNTEFVIELPLKN